MERLKIQYEWAIEHVDTHGDIQEVYHVDKLSELNRRNWDWSEPIAGCVKVDIALTRNEYTESDGLEDREYFYPDADGKLVPFACPNMTFNKSKQREYTSFMKHRELGCAAS
jgi:hypothetical protein